MKNFGSFAFEPIFISQVFAWVANFAQYPQIFRFQQIFVKLRASKTLEIKFDYDEIANRFH